MLCACLDIKLVGLIRERSKNRQKSSQNIQKATLVRICSKVAFYFFNILISCDDFILMNNLCEVTSKVYTHSREVAELENIEKMNNYI